jgi:hypothetical protein
MRLIEQLEQLQRTNSLPVASTSSPPKRDRHHRPSANSRHHSSSSRIESSRRPSLSHHGQLQNLQSVPIMTKDPNRTERTPTARAPLGDPIRTIIEGFEMVSSLEVNSRQASSRSERNGRPVVLRPQSPVPRLNNSSRTSRAPSTANRTENASRPSQPSGREAKPRPRHPDSREQQQHQLHSGPK